MSEFSPPLWASSGRGYWAGILANLKKKKMEHLSLPNVQSGY